MEDQNNSNFNQTAKPKAQELGQSVTGQPAPPWVTQTAAMPPEQVVPQETLVGDGLEQLATPPTVKKSPFAFIVPLLLFVLLGLGIFFLITRIFLPLLNKNKQEREMAGQAGGNDEKTKLNWWGLWEAESIIQPLILDYQKDHPQVEIVYQQQSYKDYRERLQSALAKGEGPDIFRLHHSWLPMLKKDLAPAPENIAQNIGLKDNFYPLVSQTLQSGSQTLAVPLGFDALILFYNPRVLKEAGKNVPSNWREVQEIAVDLCISGAEDKKCAPGEKILFSGAALGTTNNIEHFADILGLMMLQNGVDLKNPTGDLAEDALTFYTFFSQKERVWDSSLPPATYAFAQEKVAMIFAPSWRAHDIRQINPHLEFRAAAMPQLDPQKPIAWGTFWVEGVSANSPQSTAAWEFLQYLSSKDTLVKFYNQAGQVRKFGEPYPRVDLASQLEDDPIVGAVIKQANFAQSWYLVSQTYDNGINDKMIKYFENAVNAVLAGESVSSSLATAAQGVTQVLDQYGVK